MCAERSLLEVDNVSIHDGNRRILLPVTFSLQAGEKMMITGASGSGKSTLLKIIASLIPAGTGSITFSGKPITEWRAEEYRQRVSYCFQSPVLFGDTVYDNLAFPWLVRNRTPPRTELCRSLERVNLSNNFIDKRIIHLSGGEKQRVALMRNLQFMPDILLLDEVTSALDDQNRAIVNKLIDDVSGQYNVAVLSVSHLKEEHISASRVLTLNSKCPEVGVGSA